MASKSKKKPPTTSSDRHESRQWREDTAAPRDAEIARRPRLSSSRWSQLQSHCGQGTAGWKSWASIARSATAVSLRWTAGARSSALDLVGRTAHAPKGRAARRARRCILVGAVVSKRAPCVRARAAVQRSWWCEKHLLCSESTSALRGRTPQELINVTAHRRNSALQRPTACKTSQSEPY